jgi:hypothetical protein
MTATPASPAQPPAASAEAAATTKPSGRRALVWSLVVLATLIGVISILASWVNQQALDNEAWEDTSEEIIQDPKIADALSAYVVNQLYSNVDVASELEQRLPENLQRLAAPAAAALRQPMADGVRRLLEQPRIQQLFINASVLSHQKLINVVDNKTGLGISTGDGVVTVDVRELIGQVGTELGVPAAALAKLPQNVGQIEVMRSSQLSAAQTGARGIAVLDVWLAPLVLVLFGLAIYLARGFRRETLRNISWAFVLVGLAVLVFRRVGGNSVIDALVAAPNRDAMDGVWLSATDILGSIGRATVFYGLFGVLAATLAGPTAPATSVRGWIAPVLNNRPGIAWSVAGVAYLLLILWAPTRELRQPAWILILGAILAVGLIALRRQTRREFADAQPGGFAAAVRSVTRRNGTSPEPVARFDKGGDGAADEIARLGELREAGLITDDEFDRGKTRALA